MRTFTLMDASSNKFWNIDLQGKRFTVTYGKIGTAGQTQIKEFSDNAAAAKEHDNLVAEKLKKGYRETTPTARVSPTSMREALEQALIDNPDDLASHMAYADYLQEQNDPLGEFIRIQLELEDATRSPEDRKKLSQQEAKLLKAHQAAWFGELTAYLFHKKKPRPDFGEIDCKYTFRRGWIDSLEIKNYTVELTRTLAHSPHLRLLRRLVLDDNQYEDETEYKHGPDIPKGCEFPQLYPLGRSQYLGNVREFILGEIPSPQDENTAHQGSFTCHTSGDGAIGIIKQMPKLEELRLFAHGVDTKQLFALKTLNHLRLLQVYHNQDYPLAALAKNPSLGRLTHLLLHPHALEEEHAFIRTPAVKAVVNSPELKSLTHLQLRLSDMGDKGVAEIIASSILARLKVLDLRHGCISDVGAKRLAACLDAVKLERLDLMRNNMTAAGIEALRSAGIKVEARHQWAEGGAAEWGDGDQDYLYAGDIE